MAKQSEGQRWLERQLERTASEVRKHKRALAIAEQQHRAYRTITAKEANALFRDVLRCSGNKLVVSGHIVAD